MREKDAKTAVFGSKPVRYQPPVSEESCPRCAKGQPLYIRARDKEGPSVFQCVRCRGTWNRKALAQARAPK